jgi:hypothetical protein
MHRRFADRHRAFAVTLLVVTTGCSVLRPTDRPPATYEGIEVLAGLPQIPGSAGATAWQTTVEPPPGMGVDDTTYGSPGPLLGDLARESSGLGGEVRIAFIGAPESDTARAAIQSWGAFSSVFGMELDLALRKGPKGWYVVQARVRSHCHRGVSADGSTCL